MRNSGTLFLFCDCVSGRYRQLEFNVKFGLSNGDSKFNDVSSNIGLLSRIGLL